MDRKWNLKQQAEQAKRQVSQWPEWMRDTGYFVGTQKHEVASAGSSHSELGKNSSLKKRKIAA